MVVSKIYNTYTPIINKLGKLSKFIIEYEFTESGIPNEFIDDNGFLRLGEFIIYKRGLFVPASTEEIDFPLIELYAEDNYPEYYAFLTIVAMLLKSVKIFEHGKQIWKEEDKIDINDEKKELMLLKSNVTVLGTFLTHSTFTEPIPEENEKLARQVIKAVMITANAQYKTLKEDLLDF